MKTDCPTCETPVLIVSPTLKQDILRSNYLLIDGVYHTITPDIRGRVLAGEKPSRLLHLPYVKTVVRGTDHQYYQVQTKEQEEFVSRYLLVNTDSGEMFPCYRLVACGKCDACFSRKQTSYIQRCQFQQLQDHRVPLFFTLTYNDAHYPSSGVCLSDVQKFKKRFRTWYSRLFNRNSNELKFFITSEYGKKGRAHYHCLCFGWSADDTTKNSWWQWKQRLKFIQFCWREPYNPHNKPISEVFDSYCKSFPLQTYLEPDYDPRSFGFVNLVSDISSVNGVTSYVAKYITKNIQIKQEKPDFIPLKYIRWNLEEPKPRKPKSKLNPCFRPLMSPNMGVEFVYSYADNLEKKEFQYLDTFDCKVKTANLCSYYLHKLYPSYSHLIPSTFRNSFYNLVEWTYILQNVDWRNVTKRRKISSWCNRIRIDLFNRFPFMDIFQVEYPKLNARLIDPDEYYVTAEGDLESKDSSFRSFINDYHVCFTTDIDIGAINKRIAKRDKFFQRYRSADQPNVSAIASAHRRSVNVSLSKSKL